MSHHPTSTIMASLRFILNYPYSQSHEATELETIVPRPWFADEETAFAELKGLAEFAKTLPTEPLRIDAINKLVSFHIDDLILEEAPSYKLYWMIQREELINILRQHHYLGKRYHDHTR